MAPKTLIGLLVLLVAAVAGCQASGITRPFHQIAAPRVATVPAAARPVPTPIVKSASASSIGTPVCRAADLKVAADWQSAPGPGSMVGRLVVTNQAATACTLRGRPALQLIDGQGLFLFVTTAASATASATQPITVAPGQQAALSFMWHNWCEPKPAGGVSLVVRLPGDLTPLTVPAPNPAGAQAGAAPRCTAPGAPSTLAVSLFEPVSSP